MPNEAQFYEVRLRRDDLLAQLPLPGSRRPGLSARELIVRVGRDHYPGGPESPREIRKIQRDLADLIALGRVVVADPPTRPPTYLRARPDDEEVLDTYE